jgi:hypothetical protein
MELNTSQVSKLAAEHRIFARYRCDKCGRLLGAVRFTRRGDAGEWCSRECRGDAQRVKIHKGGRPRRYRSNADRQRAYRGRNLGVTKPVCSLVETNDLQA